MKNIPITVFESYLRLVIAYLPILVPPLYLKDDGAWVIPLVYFCTCLWLLPMIVFTEGREETKEATTIMRKGMLPLMYLMLGGLAISAVLFLFGGGRW